MTSSDPALQFGSTQRIGRVLAVDTSRVYIDVDDHELLTRVSVGNLIAIQGTIAEEFLIGVTERVTRQLREEALLHQEDEKGVIPVGETNVDAVRVVLIGTYRTREGDCRNVFKRGADSFPQIERSCYLIEGGNLQRLMALLGKELTEEKQLRLGTFALDRNAVAVADGDRFFQRHASILGSTGSGKSWTVALILERVNALSYPSIIVLDMHGEYAPLAKDDGFAAGLRVAGPGDLDKPGDDVLFLPFWLLNREEMLAILLDRSDQNAPNQASRFTTHVRALKSATLRKGKNDEVLATFTVDSPIPYSLQELIEKLKDDNTAKKPSTVPGKSTMIKGDWEDRLTRFIARLEAKVEDRRYGFMFQPPDKTMRYEWLQEQAVRLLASDKDHPGIKVIDFSEVPSDVLPVMVGVLARVVYDVQFWLDPRKRTPVAIVCDEAHVYLPVKETTDVIERRALEAFERIAKEGRKYGVSLLVVSQRPSDVSRTILSQCNNFLVLRLTNDQDQAVVRRLLPESMSGMTEVLPLLDIGEALLLGDAVLLPARIKLDRPSIVPASATRDFWTEWGDQAPDPDGIRAAVETLRRQTRPAANSDSSRSI
ncbi:MAG TPA: ATP-binding protein [Acidobacteriota bacterium]|nr:ATP-binding protein [Acidobacteriota bacterium]